MYAGAPSHWLQMSLQEEHLSSRLECVGGTMNEGNFMASDSFIHDIIALIHS